MVAISALVLLGAMLASGYIDLLISVVGMNVVHANIGSERLGEGALDIDQTC